MFRKLKRRTKKKTDYRQRLSLLKSGKPRLVVRKGLKNILVQIIKYEPEGDKILLSMLSKNLKKFGWLADYSNIPASYLTGLLLGCNALKKNIREVVADIGLQRSTKENKIYALVKGCIDAGLKIHIDEKIMPSDERIKGKYIEEYAKILKQTNPDKYKKQFSSYLNNKIEPEEISKHFEEVKKRIINELK